MKKYVVGNWKAQLTPHASMAVAEEIVASLPSLSSEAWIAASYLSLPVICQRFSGSPLRFGAQNAWPQSGAFTGEVTAEALSEIGVQFCLLGHSERRHKFLESDQLISERLKGLLPKLKVILCIGETLSEREESKTENVLFAQLQAAIADIPPEYHSNLIIAYEPVWAIGTGKVANIQQIATAHEFIDKTARGLTGGTLPILYGGSVTAETFGEMLSIPHVSGGLIGGASLKAESFIRLCEIAG